MAIRNGVTVRGTSNSNERGNSEARRRRKIWLVETFRADVEVSVGRSTDGSVFDVQEYNPRLDTVSGYTSGPEPACRCYRCGKLLIFDTVTVDRIVPGCKGGRYHRNNIRPACGDCNSETGGGLHAAVRKSKPRPKKPRPPKEPPY